MKAGRLAAFVLLGLWALAGPAAAQDRSMVFVHGFMSNGTTWANTAARLRTQLVIMPSFPNLEWKKSFSEQARDLHSTIFHVPGDPFAVAHSNGGPVAREWSKSRRLSGLLTLSSPNQGAPIANNALNFIRYNVSIITGLQNISLAFNDPSESSFWVYHVIQGALAFGADATLLALSSLGSAGLDINAPVSQEDKVGSTFMQQLNSSANLAREAASIANRAAIVTAVPDYHLGGTFRAIDPEHVDLWRAALYASVGTLDAWAAYIASSGTPRDMEKAQRMATAAFLLALHENMWCQAVSDPTPYAVTVGGACYPNDTFIPSWSHVLPGALAISKPNMPEHTRQTDLLTPVLYEVLTQHMGVVPRGSSPAGSQLRAGQELVAGQELRSPDSRYRIVYQPDGNLVVYRHDGAPVWSSGTFGTSAGRALMQPDGNFVVYDAAGAPVWHTHTYGNPGAYLSMQNNGAMVVYRADGARLWGSPVASGEVNPPPPTQTPGPDTLTAGGRLYPGQALSSLDRRFALTYQTDGNLVLYGPGGVPRWSTQIFSSPGYAEMQNDGNFVVYASNGAPIWASGTSGLLNARLVVHNDGNVVLYTSSNLVAWSTGTGGS